MSKKRLRIFAGPNGSGKSTFIDKFQSLDPKYKLGVYINADEIEKTLNLCRSLDLIPFGVQITESEIQDFFRHSKFSPIKSGNLDLWKLFTIDDHKLFIHKDLEINSYMASDLAEFLRRKLLESNLSFSFETVMSDNGKVDFLHKAKELGFSVYLYYFCTVDPEINLNRVKIRIEEKGHSVPPEKILKRYYTSLDNLKDAILLSNRSYMFDNSKENNDNLLFAEITNGTDVEIFFPEDVPAWFTQYVVNNNPPR